MRDPSWPSDLALTIGEAFRHFKTVGAWGDGIEVLEACSLSSDLPGVITAPTSGRAFAKALVEAIGWHRHWDRSPILPN